MYTLTEWGTVRIELYDATKVEIIEGCVDDIKAGPELPAECYQPPVTAEQGVKAFDILRDMVRGNG